MLATLNLISVSYDRKLLDSKLVFDPIVNLIQMKNLTKFWVNKIGETLAGNISNLLFKFFLISPFLALSVVGYLLQ